jgi:2-keto-4-pentenoate hydratase/2-oxohepta-3-ene-1,7-dioic acid hydratase in catechol pathway
MRFARFLHNGSPRFGVVEAATLRPFPEPVTTLQAYLALKPAERAALALGEPLPLDQAALLAPVRPLKNVFCVGKNYMDHAEEVARATGTELKVPRRCIY